MVAECLLCEVGTKICKCTLYKFVVSKRKYHSQYVCEELWYY